MRTIPATRTTPIAPTATTTTPYSQDSTWRSQLPYLFGGLAAMLGLIAFGILILACAYWKFSSQLQNDLNAQRDLESVGGEKQGDSANKVYEEKILVIMAGDDKPTFLATPKPSPVTRGVPNYFEENLENHVTSEKLERNHVQQPTSPQPQETTQDNKMSFDLCIRFHSRNRGASLSVS